jgi:hypothetical protein
MNIRDDDQVSAVALVVESEAATAATVIDDDPALEAEILTEADDPIITIEPVEEPDEPDEPLLSDDDEA